MFSSKQYRAKAAEYVERERDSLAVAEICIANKLPKTTREIQQLILVELRNFAGCEEARGIIVIPVLAGGGGANWTVSCFNRGASDGYACDRALQRIVPHYQQLYDLAQKH
jgi:hypothetical protein